ncbi:MAG: type II toxin-antitoxin system RelE/ParE family toxin [Gallionella sp.]|nr:type II toxin-antitoxin system RelE/ParE family toxin [Gallionella sp.]
MVVEQKDIIWVGSSKEDIRTFPKEALHEAGFQLGQVQSGLEPDNWKPFNEVGAGTKEIRIRDKDGIYRVLYVAKFKEAIYVLHCFQKKTESTAQADKEIAKARYRAISKR